MNRTRLSDGELAALAARIQRDYDYDDRSGKLVNKRTGKVVRGRKGAQRNGEYRYLNMHFSASGKDCQFQMHKIVWAWHHGRFPTLQIDHINGNGMDNRIENLREVTQSVNMRNMVYRWKPNTRTGLPGVYICKGGYKTCFAKHEYFFRDKNVAFYHLTLLGRRFK